MGILDFTTAPAASAAGQNRPLATATNPNDRPKAKVWMNIGREINGKFISLPLGQAIDTMEPAEVRGQNEDFVKQRTAQNNLLKAIQEVGASLQPGEEKDLVLTVRVRRVNDAVIVDNSSNEYAIEASSLLVA